MDNYIFFYKSESPFSNWYPSEFIVDEIKFCNTEQWMMYKKALLFKDDEIAKKILNTESPRIIKMLGRKVKNFDEKIWNENSMNIVIEGLVHKFKNEKLKKILLDTGDKILVEASPYDNIWGIGINENKAKQTNPAMWPGKNKLGICLMNARKIIRETI